MIINVLCNVRKHKKKIPRFDKWQLVGINGGNRPYQSSGLSDLYR